MTSRWSELRLPIAIAALAGTISPRTIKSVGFSVPTIPGRLGVLWDTGGIVDRSEDCVPMAAPTASNVSVLSVVPANALSIDEALAIINGCNHAANHGTWSVAANVLGHLVPGSYEEYESQLLGKGMRLPVQYKDPESSEFMLEHSPVLFPLVTAALGRLPFKSIVVAEVHSDDLHITVYYPGDDDCDVVYKKLSDIMITSLSACAKVHATRSPYIKDIACAFMLLAHGSGLHTVAEIPEGFIETIGGYDVEEGEVNKVEQEAWAAAYDPVMLLLREAEAAGVPAWRCWRQARKELGQRRWPDAVGGLDPR